MKFNQLFYGGYIGVGSPIDQTWWVDDLVVADGILTVSSQQWAAGSGQSAVGSPQVAIYPNPNDGAFTVEVLQTGNTINDHYTIAFYNTFGEKIYEEKMNASVQSFDVDLPSGMYSCYVRGENNLRALGKMCVFK